MINECLDGVTTFNSNSNVVTKYSILYQYLLELLAISGEKKQSRHFMR